MKYGVDFIYTDLKNKKWFFGSRIQWDKDYGTFTIRHERETGAKTEFEKRSKNKNENHYTFQGYFDTVNEKIMSFAIAKTDDIIFMIDNQYAEKKRTGKKQIGQAEFWVVTWNSMIYQLETEHSYETTFPILIVNNIKEMEKQQRIDNFFN